MLELGSAVGENKTWMCGFDVDAKSLANARKVLESQQPDLVVIGVNSWGGDLSECVKVADELEAIEAAFPTVVWVRAAVNDATLSVWSIDRVFMQTQANLGAASDWMKRRNGMSIQEALRQMDRISKLGHRDPRVLRAVRVPEPLSATRVGEKVMFFPDATSGEILVNREGESLSLNSVTARAIGVSQGTADDVPSLMALLGIHYYELIAPEANESLARFAEIREALYDDKVTEIRHALRMIGDVAGLVSGPTVDMEAFETAWRNATEAVDRLARFASDEPSFAAYVGLMEPDLWTGSDAQTLSGMRKTLENARHRAEVLATNPFNK